MNSKAFMHNLTRFASIIPQARLPLDDKTGTLKATMVKELYRVLSTAGWTDQRFSWTIDQLIQSCGYWPDNIVAKMLEVGAGYRVPGGVKPKVRDGDPRELARRRALELLADANRLMEREAFLPPLAVPPEWTGPLPDVLVPEPEDMPRLLKALAGAFAERPKKSAALVTGGIRKRLLAGQTPESVIALLGNEYSDGAEVVKKIAAELKGV